MGNEPWEDAERHQRACEDEHCTLHPQAERVAHQLLAARGNVYATISDAEVAIISRALWGAEREVLFRNAELERKLHGALQSQQDAWDANSQGAADIRSLRRNLDERDAECVRLRERGGGGWDT